MRLVTFTTDNLEPHVGVVHDKQVIDLTAWLGQQAWNNQSTPLTMLELISLGDEGLSLVREALKANPKDLEQASALASLSLDGLLAPIPRPPKNVICMGRNYFEHAVSRLVPSAKRLPPFRTIRWYSPRLRPLSMSLTATFHTTRREHIRSTGNASWH